AGSTDSYACSLSPAITSYKVGSHYFFKANTGNTGAASISFNTLAALTIKKPAGGVTTDLATGDIQAGQIVEVVYDGTNAQMVSQLGITPGGISGSMTTGTVPLATASTTLGNSSITEDSTNVYVAKPLVTGVCTTNCFTITRDLSGIYNLNQSTLITKSITFVIGSDSGSALTQTHAQC